MIAQTLPATLVSFVGKQRFEQAIEITGLKSYGSPRFTSPDQLQDHGDLTVIECRPAAHPAQCKVTCANGFSYQAEFVIRKSEAVGTGEQHGPFLHDLQSSDPDRNPHPLVKAARTLEDTVTSRVDRFCASGNRKAERAAVDALNDLQSVKNAANLIADVSRLGTLGDYCHIDTVVAALDALKLAALEMDEATVQALANIGVLQAHVMAMPMRRRPFLVGPYMGDGPKRWASTITEARQLARNYTAAGRLDYATIHEEPQGKPPVLRAIYQSGLDVTKTVSYR